MKETRFDRQPDPPYRLQWQCSLPNGASAAGGRGAFRDIAQCRSRFEARVQKGDITKPRGMRKSGEAGKVAFDEVADGP